MKKICAFVLVVGFFCFLKLASGQLTLPEQRTMIRNHINITTIPPLRFALRYPVPLLYASMKHYNHLNLLQSLNILTYFNVFPPYSDWNGYISAVAQNMSNVDETIDSVASEKGIQDKCFEAYKEIATALSALYDKGYKDIQAKSCKQRIRTCVIGITNSVMTSITNVTSIARKKFTDGINQERTDMNNVYTAIYNEQLGCAARRPLEDYRDCTIELVSSIFTHLWMFYLISLFTGRSKRRRDNHSRSRPRSSHKKNLRRFV